MGTGAIGASDRELVVLGTASQAPTRHRNHNGYALRWDGQLVLFDPGEGTQRQMVIAGVAVWDLARICVSHFHGDHCLGLPGVLQRVSLEGSEQPVSVHFPASGEPYFERLRHASIYDDRATIVACPVRADGLQVVEPEVDGLRAGGPAGAGPGLRLVARRLDHRVDSCGYRLEEPDGRTMLVDRLDRFGIRGPDVGELREHGSLRAGGRLVTLDEVSTVRHGQSVAFVMDTRLCDAAFELALGVDLLIAESTFLAPEQHLATEYGHMTARDAATLAAEAGARRLVLTHFSQRHPDERAFLDEALPIHRDAVAARDLLTIPVPARVRPTA